MTEVTKKNDALNQFMDTLDVVFLVGEQNSDLINFFETLEQGRFWWLSFPEDNDHPKFQAETGEKIFYRALEGMRFVIATHSDYLIDRFRLQYIKEENKNKCLPKCCVMYLENKSDIKTAYPLLLDEDGLYPEGQPDSFQRFFIEEDLALLNHGTDDNCNDAYSAVTVYPIIIDGEGRYSPEQPDSFRDWFMEENLKLLKV